MAESRVVSDSLPVIAPHLPENGLRCRIIPIFINGISNSLAKARHPSSSSVAEQESRLSSFESTLLAYGIAGDVLWSQHHLLRDEDTVVELALRAELPKKACAFAEPSRGNAGSNGIINGGREEGAVALQALGCIDFSDARRRRGVA
ncbi:hypothetical protein V8E54_013930 [Elaphomyces granulatus]